MDAIEVTTIHKSKGLAYDVVMLPFCSWDLDGMTNGDFWIDTAGSPFEILGKIPVKYAKIVGQSIFYKQYYEEMLFNYMDALNTFYVATTRAIQHLYILRSDVVMLPFCSWDLDGMTNGDFWIDTAGSPFEILGKIPVKYAKIVGQSIFYKQYYEEMLFNYMDALNTFYVATTRAIQHLYIL